MHTCCSLFLTQEHQETHVGTIVQYCLSFHLINDWIFSQDHDSCHGVWSHGIRNTWLGYLRVTVSLGNKERTINMLYCFRCCCCLVLFVCFNKQLILCKFSRQPLTSEWGSGQSCLEPVWLYFPEFSNSSPSLFRVFVSSGIMWFPELFTVNILMTSYLCTCSGYFSWLGTLDSHCVQRCTSPRNWSRIFIHLHIWGWLIINNQL